jgi:3-phosphoshikimate 1-carboxyvinyltransferase
VTAVEPWAAPTATGPLDATVRLPGSKSLTARYLVLAALAQTPSHLGGVLQARDSSLMEQGLAALGSQFSHTLPDAVAVVPASRPVRLASPAGATIDVGLAGTVMRFLAPVAALAAGETHFDGDEAARQRPMGALFDALERLGIDLHRPPGGLALPFSVRGSGRVTGGSVQLDARHSSQFLSALALAAPLFDQGLTIQLSPPVLPSRPHVELTIEALRRFGATASQLDPWSWRVEPGGLTGQDLAVEADLSNAAPFLAAALVAGGTVRVPDWPARTAQPGDRLRDYLQAFGAEVRWTRNGDSQAGELAVSAPGGQLNGVDLDLSPAGELAPCLAALAALASSPSRLSGIGHLRGHETNRLVALQTEIVRLGGAARELDDGLEIEPRPLRGALVRTYGDHRLATFGALIGLAVPGVRIDEIGVTTKTLPQFGSLWRAMAATERRHRAA